MIVAAAILMASLILLGAVVIQVGAWFQDRRHLQVRADAGALAGAQMFNECFADESAAGQLKAKADIENWAKRYAGFASSVGAAENTSFGQGSNNVLFQSKTYPGSSPGSPDDTNTGNECVPDNLALDVKLSQDTIGGLFSFSPLATVHGHARVELKQVESVRPSLPIAIPSFDTSNVGVTFVNESSNGTELTGCAGSVVAAGKCTYAATGGPTTITVNGVNYKQWTLHGLGVKVPSGGADIGIRVAAGGLIDGSCAQTDGTNNFACFELGSNNGASMIRGYSNAGTTDGSVTLFGVWPMTSCGVGAPFVSDLDSSTSCGATLKAELDFGTGATNPTLASSLKATVTAVVTTSSGTSTIPLTATATKGSHGWIFSAPAGAGSIPIDPSAGSSENNIELDWTINGGNGKNNHGSFTDAQRFASATDEDDGPLKGLSVAFSGGDPSPISPYSLSSADSSPGYAAGIHNLDVTVTLATEGITHKLTILRGAHKGSATSYILCTGQNGTPGIISGIENGCSIEYGINPIPACPDPANPTPPDCATNKPSNDSGNPISKAYNSRFSCGKKGEEALNNWPNYAIPGDPRAVTLVITTYNAYSNGGKNNGKEDYPVIGFGDFYVTGFTNSNCPQSGPGADDPAPPTASKGDVWGYFINYDRQGSIPSGKKCQLNVLATCVAVLTR